jgi:two-component system, OmpR family, response regulator
METVTSSGHVLYVEDHDDTRVLMTLMLERAGFRVTSVENASAYLKLVEGVERFDLYLLNHTFPDASGISLCNLIRQRDAQTPILFYSSRALPQEKEEALKAGAQDYLTKPNDLFNVAQHVAKWIELNRRSKDSADSV